MQADISLANWFLQRALRSPERRALTFEGTTLTYGATQRLIEQYAARLAGLGVTHRTRVAFLGQNQPDFLITLFAAARLGAIFVPLNFRLTGPEIAFIVADCGAEVLIADPAHRPVVDGVRAELASVRHFLTAQSDAGGWERLDAPAGDVAPAAFRTAPDDVAVIMYTSGTTGRPKGAMLTHGNIWWNNANAMHTIDFEQNDVTLTSAPMFHIGGLNVLTLATLQKGGEVVLHRTFDPGRTLAAIEEHRVTTFFGVPAMFQFMSQHPDFATADLSSLRVAVCGGAPCPEPLLRLYGERSVPMQQGYGLTETSPMVSFLAPEFGLSKLGSSGRPPLFTEIRLIDGGGEVVREPGAPGEVLVRGPNVMAGYWNRPEDTEAVIDAEGWFRTGDIAYLDDEGFLTICDRSKDMIISGGENVYPAEVESVLFRHPSIAEIAVIGEPDESWGERVVAVAALKPGQSLNLEELRAFAGESLARYKLPRRLEIMSALPRNTVGKVLKFELRRAIVRTLEAAQ
jgi:fatty-acyl-CoA synthase